MKKKKNRILGKEIEVIKKKQMENIDMKTYKTKIKISWDFY